MSKPELTADCVFDDRGMTCTHQITRTWIIAKGAGPQPATWPLSNPSCNRCYDMPPPGFTCNECGVGAPLKK